MGTIKYVPIVPRGFLNLPIWVYTTHVSQLTSRDQTLAAREPISYGPELFHRDLDPEARGFLRSDTPNYWYPDLPALKNLARQQVLWPSPSPPTFRSTFHTFGALPED